MHSGFHAEPFCVRRCDIARLERDGLRTKSWEALRAPAARRGEDGGRAKRALRLVLITLNVQVIGIAGQIRHDKNTPPRALNARGTLIREIEVCDE